MFARAKVTLVNAWLEFKGDPRDEDQWLEAWIFVSGDKHIPAFEVEIPTQENPDPETWRGIAEITGITSAEVAQGWTEVSNPVAQEAFALLLTSQGLQFLAQQTTCAHYQVILLPYCEDLVPPEPVAAPERRYQTDTVTAVHGPNFETSGQPYLTIVHEKGETHLRLPSKDFFPDEGGTPEYFDVELITHVAGEAIFHRWNQDVDKSNPFAKLAIRRLSIELRGKEWPLRDDGTLHMRLVRRQVLQSRCAPSQLGQLPYIFTRWDHLVKQRIWSVLSDVSGHLYRWADSADSLGIPAELQTHPSTGRVFIAQKGDAASLGALLSKHLIIATVNRKTGDISNRTLPTRILNEMIAEPDRDLPEIKGIITVPLIKPSGEIKSSPGYDPITRFYVDPEIAIEELPERPGLRDLQAALLDLHDILGDFALTPDNYAAAVCILLEQLTRPFIQGARPIHVITAPGIGQQSGKSLLADICGFVIHGDTGHNASWPEREEERVKTITTVLRERAPYKVFDNITHVVDSPGLATLSTANNWSSRLLGKNEQIACENLTTWVLTLNNARLSTDMVRRCVVIQLDLGGAVARVQQQRRTFRYADLRAHTKKRATRACTIRALMIMIRHWLQAGRPAFENELKYTSYENWIATVGAIARNAGLASIQPVLDRVYARDEESDELTQLIEFWYAGYHEQWVPAVEAGKQAMEAGVLYVPSNNPAWAARLIAKQLKPLIGREYAGYLIEHDTLSGRNLFRLSRSGK